MTDSLRAFIVNKLKDKVPRKIINQEVREMVACGKTTAYALIKEIELPDDNKKEKTIAMTKEISENKTNTKESSWEKTLEFKEKYVYNKETDKYIFPTKRVKSGNVVIPGEKWRSIQADYSNFDGKELSTEEVARRHEIPKLLLSELLTRMGIKHESFPITDEEVASKSEDALVDEMLEIKKFNVLQKLEKQEWKTTQTAAQKWVDFKLNVIDPFETFVSTWKPPVYEPIIPIKWSSSTKQDKYFVVGAFDWHVGALSEEIYLHDPKEKGWNIASAQKTINQYLEAITKDVNYISFDYKECVLLMGGDLMHAITGATDKGTEVTCDRIRDTQFNAFMDAIIPFINGLLQIFGKLRIECVRGNHTGTFDYQIGRMLKGYYRTEKNITFNVYSPQTAYVRIGPVLMLLDHGANDMIKAVLPSGKEKEIHILDKFLDRPELLTPDVKQKIFVTGDKHHYEQKEFNNFEFFMFGALPFSDNYAEAMSLKARSRQNCLVIGDNGVEAVKHIYF